MWPKFRHDFSNTGNQPSGSVESIATTVKAVQVDAGQPSAISASPAITLGGSVYVGSESGTLLATDANLNVKWRVTSCTQPPPPATPIPATCDLCAGPGLGPLVSSPAVYTQPQTSVTTIVVASENGCVYGFQDEGTTASCVACFRPMDYDSGITAASFVSSPTFAVNPATLNLTGFFIGATLDRQAAEEGRLYAINTDSSLKWEFPSSSVPPAIGPITSSPAFGTGGSLYFTTDDASLYALTANGTLQWRLPAPTHAPGSPTPVGIPSLTPTPEPCPPGLSLPFAPSPLTANVIYVPTTGDGIFAIPPDGTISWQLSVPNEVLAASLAIGAQGEYTPTPLPAGTPSPTPPYLGSPSPTLTPVIVNSTIFGVTKSGMLLVVDALTGRLLAPSGPLPTPVSGCVVSSPALSADLFLVFGTGNGMLYSVNTVDGTGPPKWPLTLTGGAAIRSSPAISFSGVIYVGADDGKLYAVGIQ